jgi:mannose-1-phosphate guanylyltransferase
MKKLLITGVSGTRLWPLSCKECPKRHLPLASDNTMLQETILRLNGLDLINKFNLNY